MVHEQPQQRFGQLCRGQPRRSRCSSARQQGPACRPAPGTGLLSRLGLVPEAHLLTVLSSPARIRTWSSRVTVGRAAASTSEDTVGGAEDAGFEPAQRSHADHCFRDSCLTGLGQSSRGRGGRADRTRARRCWTSDQQSGALPLGQPSFALHYRCARRRLSVGCPRVERGVSSSQMRWVAVSLAPVSTPARSRT